MEATKALEKVKSSLTEDLSSVSSQPSLDELKIKYLGRQGLVNSLFKTLPIKTDSKIGKQINDLKTFVESEIKARESSLLSVSEDKIDVTVPGQLPPIGSVHLITQAIEEIENIFSRLGFVRRRYPEVDTDWYYAEGLNIPKDHPARDDQETFYVSEGVVLTAHTSNGQLREMELMGKPPIKMTNIGKTYRRQTDATHNPMFHQFEGLVIDKNINITHLIGITEHFVKAYFGLNRTVRLRPHHFQFTEPSFEIDISCGLCEGRGEINGSRCKICKSGWLELGGAGMVHPTVLKNGGIDPLEYSGFAFGWGVERVLMMKSGLNLPDLRQLFSDDLRFLKQF
ncbi:MAG: Phenylalanine-tRNA ligase alpha subunit [Candidatus Collierbacteria bacterium GW2011_GWF1_44_12]|uniref:Phenylalanine--tRNA ligase alpha subunit n=3 Tax=Candidatus Collieribacteriota TaxID=1752725 RepID=A0A0G1RBI9_9BACT|nr:MAG: Phenylalanine-tRNA ligase alpha subunit [Candidatus Collierbacteria bacterium GW2011_GWA1_44_12]KKT36656.1 MAG: Phenylalanine-tRNA ligase alpha subunit [Candidatus Collierbacteria bacterium GW2011_GWF1_44_12]KKU27383.1 MAG: Phenylalanine-tRNA ligase alpha subunit [Candidatus Collierbacteria bacterium GW2011_GWE1_46_18]